MSSNAIPDAIALRVALAARVLPDTDASRMLEALDRAVGLPPTLKKLAGLKVGALKDALGDDPGGLELSALKEAVAILKGERKVDVEPAPEVEPYREGEMPKSIRVACASNGGELLDGHFGSARRFLIYQVSGTESRLVEVRVPDDHGAEDKNAYRAGLISDCQVLYVASIGGPAAAKVVKEDVHPIKDPKGGSARERILALQQKLREKASPWLAKAMGQSPEERVRFDREEEDA